MNKDLSFLTEVPFFDGGIYDNKQIYENTVTSIKNAVKAGYGIKTDVRFTQDGVLICYMDDTLMRLLHVEDKVKKSSFDNISYISKFPIMTLTDLVEETKDVPMIIELHKNNLDYKLKVMDVLALYEGKYALVTDDRRTIRWIKKNYPSVPIGYKLDKKSLHSLHFYKSYDFFYVDVNLLKDKEVRKTREIIKVIGYGITSDEMFDTKKMFYDNLVCDSQLENKE